MFATISCSIDHNTRENRYNTKPSWPGNCQLTGSDCVQNLLGVSFSLNNFKISKNAMKIIIIIPNIYTYFTNYFMNGG